MNKRLFGNILASVLAILAGLAVMFISVRFLRHPESLLDWAVMVFAGLVSGIFVFFVIWGHFKPHGKPAGASRGAGAENAGK
jgi:hypothetical protein